MFTGKGGVSKIYVVEWLEFIQTQERRDCRDMESVNVVVLSGVLAEDAVSYVEEGRDWCKFQVTTYWVSRQGDRKIRTPEHHSVRMINPGTIAKYLKKGKSVVVQGRLASSPNGTFVLAPSVTFPGSKGAE